MCWLFLLWLYQLFNREFVDAVMQEWCKTMSNLPAGLRQAYEMVRFHLLFLMAYFGTNDWIALTDHDICYLGFGKFCPDGPIFGDICKAYSF